MTDTTPPAADPMKLGPPQPRTVAWAIAVIGVALSLFQLYGAGIEPLGLFYQRTIHLSFIMVLAFLIFPVWGTGRRRGVPGWAIDAVFLVLAVLSGGYIAWNLDAIIDRAGWWTQTDITMGILATITVLEAAASIPPACAGR
jgi:TRAP-type uncharacterized transport system fused permease subunit